MPLIIETSDATNSLEDSNHDVDDNDSKDASEGRDTTIQNSEPSRREKRKIKLKPCGTGTLTSDIFYLVLLSFRIIEHLYFLYRRSLCYPTCPKTESQE